MDLGTIIGLISGISILIVGIILSGGDLFWFSQLNGILIVLGGTLAATMINLPIRAIGNIFPILKNAFTDEKINYEGVIEEIVQKAKKAKKNGLLSLEADLINVQSDF